MYDNTCKYLAENFPEDISSRSIENYRFVQGCPWAFAHPTVTLATVNLLSYHQDSSKSERIAMNQFLRVVKGAFIIEIIGSVVLLILIMGYFGSTNLQRDRVPSNPGVPTTMQQ